jgi:preprotein translocase subunit SecF
MEIFKPNSNFDFMGIRMPVIAVSALLIVVAIGALAFRGLNFALDFTGGTVLEVTFSEPANVPAVRASVEQAGYESAIVQTFSSTPRDVVIRLQPKGDQKPDEVRDVVLAEIKKLDANVVLKRSDFVGPQVGEELAQNGVIAVAVVILGLLIYVGARFEMKFAVAAIAATVHDVLLTIGWFALVQREFDLNVLAGVMSVVGYSINDKIVVFDRVRENFRNLRVPPIDVLNRSINQTLSRTTITSFVAFLTVLALYLYGGAALNGMAEALMIGIVFGTLSSIFTACPILLFLGVTKQDLMPKARDLSELDRRP